MIKVPLNRIVGLISTLLRRLNYDDSNGVRP